MAYVPTYIAVWSKLRCDNMVIGDITFWSLEQKWASGVEWMGDTPQSHTARAPAVLKTSQSRIIRSITTLKVRVSEMHQLLQLPAASNVINAAALNTFAAAVSTSSTIAGGAAALSLIFHFKCSCKSVTHKRWDLI